MFINTTFVIYVGRSSEAGIVHNVFLCFSKLHGLLLQFISRIVVSFRYFPTLPSQSNNILISVAVPLIKGGAVSDEKYIL